MLRRSPLLAAGIALATAVTIATPSLASAHSAAVGVNNLSGSHAVHSAATTHSVQPAGAQAFPSSSSTVIGSVGFIDDIQCGYFWSASRGDSVEQTVSGPSHVKKAILKVDVPYNGLATGIDVDWTLSINGTDVGSFSVSPGQTSVTEKFKFAKISGGSYDVKLRVTNEVPSGDGSITLRYAGTGAHSITLKRR